MKPHKRGLRELTIHQKCWGLISIMEVKATENLKIKN